MGKSKAKKEELLFSDQKNAPDDDQVDAEFWATCRAEDVQEDLLNPYSNLYASKKPQIQTIKMIQNQKNVLLNQKAAQILGIADLKMNKATLETIQDLHSEN